ncbi:neural proliferation differentiation and control protein 1a isoform 2-T2 [Aulostomus maculatus]
MLLLSSPRSGRLRRASVLLLVANLLCGVPVSASLPAGRKCPLPIDCANERRQLCKPGSTHCGPCLSLFEENEEGHCVIRKRHHYHGKITDYPDLDEEIDYLHSYIEKLELSEDTPMKKQFKHPVTSAAVISLTDTKKSKTESSKLRQENRPVAQQRKATTTAPHPVSAALNTAGHHRATGVGGRAGPLLEPTPKDDSILVIVISLCVVVGTVAVILATVCYVKLQKKSRQAQKVDYPAFKGMGVPAAPSNGTTMGDKTLAQSAQMFHYQHQKQQMLSMGNSHKPEQKVVDSEVTSDEEEVGGDFTVYECPGLAPTGEMEVKNPLFDDSTINYQGNENQ